jgi:hypothetical protein
MTVVLSGGMYSSLPEVLLAGLLKSKKLWHNQIEGLDYDEKFAPIVKFTSIRILLTITAHNDLEIHQIDIKTAFLNGELKEEIYLKPPPGAVVDKALVWRLLKPLYGLKQARRQWYQKVHAKFTAIGFVRLEADHSIF